MAEKSVNITIDENVRKHLDYVQAVITRLNANSFQIKVVSITIISALLTLSGTSKYYVLMFIGIFPAIIFWFLDAYYVQQERKFRALYNDVAGITQNHVIQQYEMPIDKYSASKLSYYNAFRSLAIAGFYLPIIILLAVVGIVVNCI